MKVFIDLFCGLGGASSAFVQAQGWKVIQIDNNEALLPHVHGMILADVHDTDNIKSILTALLFEHTDEIEQIVVWASPPCTEFSLANPLRPEEPDMTLLEDTIEIIRWIVEGDDTGQMNPLWVIENVKGAIEFFNDELGRPWHQRIGPIFLWGTIPWIDFVDAASREHKKTDRGAWTKGSRALRPNLRAMVPWDVSQGLLNALEHQTSLTDFVRLL